MNWHRITGKSDGEAAWRKLGRLTHFGLRLALALVFIYAGAAKLTDIQAFANIIAEYGLVPEAFIAPAAWGLPILEILAGIGLILRIPGSLAILTALTVVFALVLKYAILAELQVDCGCFSP